MTIDFVLSRASIASVARVGAPEHRPRHGDRQGDARLRGQGAARRAVARYTERTITDPDRLADEVATVRRLRPCARVGEREPDLNAVAVPVFGDPGELIAILGVQGPESRFRVRVQNAAVPLLRSHALALSTELGYGVA